LAHWFPFNPLTIVVSALVLFPLLGLIAQRGLGISIPQVDLLLASLVGCIAAMLGRRREEEVEVGRVQQQLTGVVAQRLARKHLAEATDPWPEVQRFLTLHLNLSRSILLELPSSNHHVREVVSHGCSIDDIDERRRDVRRSPYAEAVSNRQPTELSRPFLKPELATGVDFLTPLRFGPELVGFWYAGFFGT